MEREVVVRGVAERTAMPDRAFLRVGVARQAATRDEAYATAGAETKKVDVLLADNAALIGNVVHSALVVQQLFEWDKGGRRRETGWSATRSTVVEVTDLTRVGDLVAEVVASGAAIAGVDWALDADNPVHAAARVAAAEDARRRATDYAAALGLSLAEVAWIAEPGLRAGDGSDGHAFGRRAAASSRMFAEVAMEPVVVDLAPGEIDVSASVEVGFRIGDA